MYIWAMKFLAFILSIYILVLNLTICEDKGVADANAKIEISQNLDTNYGHSDLDFCSPFCQCQCCNIYAIFIGIPKFDVASAFLSTEVIYYFDKLEDDITFSILRPPRI